MSPLEVWIEFQMNDTLISLLFMDFIFPGPHIGLSMAWAMFK